MLDWLVGEDVITSISELPCKIQLPPKFQSFFEAKDTYAPFVGDRRQFRRCTMRGMAALQHQQTLPALKRKADWHRVFSKDVSRCGCAFLHSEQLFPCEEMKFVLLDGVVRDIRIIRCQKQGEQCFEVGAEFY